MRDRIPGKSDRMLAFSSWYKEESGILI